MPNVRLEDVPESDRQYELVGGEKVWLPLRSVYSLCLANVLWQDLDSFLDGRGLGRAHLHMLYDLGLPGEVNRRPSVSYLSRERWPNGRQIPPGAEALPVVPDIAAEVLGPDDFAETTLGKVTEYLSAGVRQVWVLCPSAKVVYVCNRDRPGRLLRGSDILTADDVLPGFGLRLGLLFQNPPCQQVLP